MDIDITEMSSATLRNWKRMGVSDVSEKGTKRANKRFSEKQFIPDEYIKYKDVIVLAYKFLSIGYSIKEIIYCFCLNLSKNIKNVYIGEELKSWKIQEKRVIHDLVNYKIGEYKGDLLGGIYQSLLTEGEKNKKGSYYTPDFVVIDQISSLFKDGYTVLDPCCGTGQYLINIPSSNPLNIRGFDSDELAVKIARINLMLRYPLENFKPNIFHLDSLDMENDRLNGIKDNYFDLVMTNPPRGAKIERKYGGYSITSGESFSFFIERGLHLLKDSGILSYILPESILNVKVHADIRKVMLNYDIVSIHELGKIFTGVFTDVIRIDIRKSREDGVVDVYSNGKTHTCHKIDFKNNSDYIFSIHVRKEDNELFSKLYSREHIFLDNINSDWALGIVTGNNKAFISDCPGDGYIPVFTGKEVAPYKLLPPKKYLLFKPEKFQQMAPLEKYYAKPKLIYKFISKKLVFSLDNEGVFTLNSANILVPKVDYPIKVIAVLFNSKLYQDVYEKKFNSIKILKSQIQELPLPILSDEEYQNIEDLFDKVYSSSISKEEVDEYIFNLLLG